jgi:hypothetical protein
VESPEWTDADRGLLLGLGMWEATLCPGGCGHTIDQAWHTDNDGWFEVQGFKCYACTELAGGDDVVFHQVDSTRSPDDPPLAPFELGVTTFAPDPTPPTE